MLVNNPNAATSSSGLSRSSRFLLPVLGVTEGGKSMPQWPSSPAFSVFLICLPMPPLTTEIWRNYISQPSRTQRWGTLFANIVIISVGVFFFSIKETHYVTFILGQCRSWVSDASRFLEQTSVKHLWRSIFQKNKHWVFWYRKMVMILA